MAANTWNGEVRPIVDEAVRCYGAGAYRSCIVATWTAVCADIFEKVVRLSEEGAGDAVPVATRVAAVRAGSALGGAGIRETQALEQGVLGTAVQLELIDPVAKDQLERLRQDRNLCAHPALLPLDGYFRPEAEVARAHLVVALETLLQHPPMQGRKARDRFHAFLVGDDFTGTERVITSSFYDACRAATRRNIFDLAIKLALLDELAQDAPIPALSLADRAALCVYAFAAVDRPAVAALLRKSAARLQDASSASVMRAAVRLRSLDEFWTEVPPVILDRIKASIADTPATELPREVFALLVRDKLRTMFPLLETRFTELNFADRAAVIDAHPAHYFASHSAKIIRDAGSFRGAETACQQGVLTVAAHLDSKQLAMVLDAWCRNDQCVSAAAMPAAAVELFERTRGLLPDALDAWLDFLDGPNTHVATAAEDEYYSYPELRALVEEAQRVSA